MTTSDRHTPNDEIPTVRPTEAPGPASDVGSALSRIVVCLVVAAALSSHHLVAAAEALPFGRTRSVMLSVANSVNADATAVRLDRPDRLLRRLTAPTGRPDSPSRAQPAVAAATMDRAPATLTPPTMGPARPPPASTAGADDPGASPTRGPIDAAPPSGTSPPTSAGSGRNTPSTMGPPHPAAPNGPGQVIPPTSPRPAEVTRVVAEHDKLRIWAGGDSLGEYVGNQLLHPIGDPDLTETVLDYHISTGLARPDYFDWLQRIDEVMSDHSPPEAMVFMVGGNDDQALLAGGTVLDTGSPEWLDEYGRRVSTIMDRTETGSTQLYWIGLPPMREQRREELAVEVNRIVAEAASERSWVTFVDIVPLFSDPGGGFTTQVADRDGDRRVARAPDGVHITYVGSTWIAERVWADLIARWSLVEALSEPPPLPPTAAPLPPRRS